MTLRKIVAALGILGLVAIAALGQTTIKKVPVTVRTSPADAKASYNEYCAVCHGPSGKGDGPAAVALKKAPTDLTQLTKKNGGKYPDAKVSHYIAGEEVVAAHGSRDMPIWGTVFHSIDAQDKTVDGLRVYNLVEYIKTLQVE